MRGTVALIVIILVSGASAGLVYGTVGVLLAGPYLEAAIEVENSAMFAAGDAEDTVEFRAAYESYREWQRGGHIVTGIVLGASIGSLFGAVYVASHASLPGRSHVAKALAVAGVMWVALYVVPFVKYPPSPPAVGDPDTIAARTLLFLVLVAASGLGALGFAKMSAFLARTRRLGARQSVYAGIVCYAAFAAVLLVAMPQNPDPEPDLDGALLDGFRAASAAASASFWVAAGVILGALWPLRDRWESVRSRGNIDSDSIY